MKQGDKGYTLAKKKKKKIINNILVNKEGII